MIIIFAIIVTILWLYSINNDKYIEGFWLAQDDDFTERANIKSMMLYIGPATGFLKLSREIYLVITDSVANTGAKINYFQALNCTRDGYEIVPTIEWDTDETELMPSGSTWSFDFAKGSLKIAKDKKVYAELYKNFDITNTASRAVIEDTVQN